MAMTELEKRASGMTWDPPAPGTEERKKMPKSAFLSPSTRTFPYKILIEGQWVISEKGLRSAISVANFQGNSTISKKASKILESLISDEETDKSLAHYGILGMKWGVRRYQNADGTRTTAGKKRDADIAIKKERKQTMVVRRHLSEGDLKKAVERLQMEKKLVELTKEDLAPGKEGASKILKQIGKTAITAAGGAVATYAIKAALEGKFDVSEAAKFIRPKK